MFALAGVDTTVLESEYSGHVTKLVAEMESLSAFDMIVTVSGDGLFHELINGIMQREDWETSRSIPLSMIAGGTASALSKNLDTMNPAYSALSIIKGKTRPMDIFSYYLTSKKTPIYSHLNLTWAIIADVDIESEKVLV
jgi:sphingosine kinase